MEQDKWFREDNSMKFYKIPFDIKHEEKIFSGYLSLRQVLYLLLTGLSGIVFFIKISKLLRLLIFLTFAIIFLSFSFIKINEIRLDRYVINIIKFLIRKRKFEYER